MRLKLKKSLLLCGRAFLIFVVVYIILAIVRSREEGSTVVDGLPDAWKPKTGPDAPGFLNLPKALKKWDNITNRYAQIRIDVEPLLQHLGYTWHWNWIQGRIQDLWPEWVAAAKEFSLKNRDKPYIAKKILILPGVITLTDFARPETIRNGGPLGELVQWADLLACFYVLGHDVTAFYDVRRMNDWLKMIVQKHTGNQTQKGCVYPPLDLIYTDFAAFQSMSSEVRNGLKSKLRFLDAFGTEAMYNDPVYAAAENLKGYSIGLGLNLKQILTMYPHTPDNSFLGFVVSSKKMIHEKKKDIALLYGKDVVYLKENFNYLNELSRFLKLHATMPYHAYNVLPKGSENHGIVSTDELKNIVNTAKLLIGLGDPIEGPGAIESLARGCIFFNPRFPGGKNFRHKPTSRKLSSQVPYLEQFIGQPYVFTLDTTNQTEVQLLLKKALKTELQPFIPHEFTVLGYLERIHSYVAYQDFCHNATEWPPLSSLIPFLGKPGELCNDVCYQREMVCEPTFFPQLQFTLNERFANECTKIHKQWDIFHPSMSVSTPGLCYHQGKDLLYSCAGGKNEYKRLCPCRKYKKYQIALCQEC